MRIKLIMKQIDRSKGEARAHYVRILMKHWTYAPMGNTGSAGLRPS